MATLVHCPYCGSYNTLKTSNGKLTNVLAQTGAIAGGTLINLVTGGSLGIIGANFAYGRTWHQFCCRDCHEAFKVRLGVGGYVKAVKKH